MGSKLNYSEKDIKAAVNLYVEGQQPLQTVADFFGCSIPSAKKILLEQGVTIRPKGRVKNKPAATSPADPVHSIQQLDTPVVEPVQQELKLGNPIPVPSDVSVEERRQQVLDKARNHGFVKNINV